MDANGTYGIGVGAEDGGTSEDGGASDLGLLCQINGRT